MVDHTHHEGEVGRIRKSPSNFAAYLDGLLQRVANEDPVTLRALIKRMRRRRRGVRAGDALLRRELVELAAAKISDQWLAEAQHLDSSGEVDRALDLIYTKMNALLNSRQFAVCDRILRKAQVNDHSTDILLALLTTTLPPADLLPSRSSFIDRVRSVFDDRNEDTAALLAGLDV